MSIGSKLPKKPGETRIFDVPEDDGNIFWLLECPHCENIEKFQNQIRILGEQVDMQIICTQCSSSWSIVQHHKRFTIVNTTIGRR